MSALGIIRTVKYYEYIVEEGGTMAKKVEAGVGKFHQWGNQYDILKDDIKDDLVVQYTSAIIELPDGTIENIAAELIKFIDNESMN